MRNRRRLRLKHRKGRARANAAGGTGAGNGEGDETAAELDFLPVPALGRRAHRRMHGGDQITISVLLKKQQL